MNELPPDAMLEEWNNSADGERFRAMQDCKKQKEQIWQTMVGEHIARTEAAIIQKEERKRR